MENQTKKKIQRIANYTPWSMRLFILHLLLLILGLTLLFIGKWRFGIMVLGVALVVTYISYHLFKREDSIRLNRIARENPFEPFAGEMLGRAVKEITGREGNPIELIETPEATVIQIIDFYFGYKTHRKNLNDREIFSHILRVKNYAGGYEIESEKELPNRLVDFIRMVLQIEGQKDALSSSSIREMISKYRELRGGEEGQGQRTSFFKQ